MSEKNFLVKLYKVLLGSAVITPLVMGTGGFFPFVVPKALFFRALIAVVTTFFLFLWARGDFFPRLYLLRNKITWVPAGFLLVSYIASAQGINFYHSFWSQFDRMDGLLSLTNLVIFFYLLLLSYTTEDFKKFFMASVLVSGVVSVLALMEWKHLVPFIESSNIDRPAGTIGNPAFLAGYLLMMMPLAYYFARLAKTQIQKYGFYGLSALSFFTIITTGTRGALVALIAGVFFLLVWHFVYAKNKKTKQIVVGAFALLVVMAGLFFSMREQLKESDIAIVRRTANISLSDDTTRSRLFIWQNSLSYIGARPLLGYGLENFEYVYNKMYDPSVISEEWFDRSHNVYIDLLVHTGIIGGALYALLLAGIAYALFLYRKKDELLSLVLLFLLITYAVQNFFIFDTINTSLFFFALCAYVFVMAREGGGLEHIAEKILETKDQLLAHQLSSSKKIPLYVLSVLVIVSLYWTTVQPIRANVALSEGYDYQVVDVARSLRAWNRGLSLGTFAEIEYGYQSYDSYFNRKGTASLKPEEQKASYEYTTDLLEGLIQKYPLNARLFVYLGHVFDEPVAGEVVSQEKFETILKKAMELSPKRKQAYYMLANTYLRKIDTAQTQSQKTEFLNKGAEVLKEYIKVAPNFAEPKIILANLYRSNGRLQEAKTFFEEGLRVYTPSVSVARRVIGYLLAEKDYKRVELYLKYVSDENPTDYDVLFDLAHVYQLNGKLTEARDAVLLIQQQAPQILARDQTFVQNLLK